MSDFSFTHCRKCRQPEYACDCDVPDIAPYQAERAIALLIRVRDELELAGRPSGDFVTNTRQANDSCINDLAIVARLIRKMAER